MSTCHQRMLSYHFDVNWGLNQSINERNTWLTILGWMMHNKQDVGNRSSRDHLQILNARTIFVGLFNDCFFCFWPHESRGILSRKVTVISKLGLWPIGSGLCQKKRSTEWTKGQKVRAPPTLAISLSLVSNRYGHLRVTLSLRLDHSFNRTELGTIMSTGQHSKKKVCYYYDGEYF